MIFLSRNDSTKLLKRYTHNTRDTGRDYVKILSSKYQFNGIGIVFHNFECINLSVENER